VDTLPQASINQSKFFICKGQLDTLSANSESSYEWSPSTGLNTTTGDTVIASPDAYTIYTVIVTGSNGCTNTASIPVYVETPDIIVSPPSTSVCPGHGISLTVSGAASYHWNPSASIDSVSFDSVVASPTTTTTYTIIGNNRFCSDTVQAVVTVALPHVIITPSSPSTCYGSSIALYASGADTFQWRPSATLSDTIGDTVIAAPTVTTTYTVIGRNGCADSTTTVVTVDSIPQISVNGFTSVCLGQSTPLVATGASTYQWSPSTGLNTTTGDSVVVTPTAATTYSLTGYNSYGCVASILVNVTIIPSPNKPSFRQHGDTLISSSQHDNQWYRNDSLLIDDTSQYLIITALGEYWVVVTNEVNGCGTASDSAKIDSITGINQLSVINEELSVYPNPFSDEIFVTINSSAQDVTDWNLQITDVLGRTVYTKASLNYTNAIDLSKISSGVYFITVTSKNGRAVFPVIRQE
jgi:hypothetical protein